MTQTRVPAASSALARELATQLLPARVQPVDWGDADSCYSSSRYDDYEVEQCF